MFLKLNTQGENKRSVCVRFDDISLIEVEIIERTNKNVAFRVVAETGKGRYSSDGIITDYPSKDIGALGDSELTNFLNTNLVYILSPEMIRTKVLLNIDIALVEALKCKNTRKIVNELVLN